MVVVPSSFNEVAMIQFLRQIRHGLNVFLDLFLSPSLLYTVAAPTSFLGLSRSLNLVSPGGGPIGALLTDESESGRGWKRPPLTSSLPVTSPWSGTTSSTNGLRHGLNVMVTPSFESTSDSSTYRGPCINCRDISQKVPKVAVWPVLVRTVG